MAGLQSSRSSGRVTAGIACNDKLKRDGWRVVDLLSRGGRPHHSIPIILWAVALQPFLFSGQLYTMHQVEERILLTKVHEMQCIMTEGLVLAGNELFRWFSIVNGTMQEKQSYRSIHYVTRSDHYQLGTRA